MKEIQLFTSAMDAEVRTQAAHAFGIDLGTTNSSVAEASWASGESAWAWASGGSVRSGPARNGGGRR